MVFVYKTYETAGFAKVVTVTAGKAVDCYSKSRQ